MPKATIKTKSGAVITVEGSEKEVSSILADYERSSVVHQVKKMAVASKVVQKEKKKRAAASDLIIILKEDGFFNKPRSLAEVAKALEETGYIYPVTTLSGVMIGLVQKKLLGRKKLEGKWVYGK
jgi:predicted transcriptional regulator YheO